VEEMSRRLCLSGRKSPSIHLTGYEVDIHYFRIQTTFLELAGGRLCQMAL
jgi:hypothetical protein